MMLLNSMCYYIKLLNHALIIIINVYNIKVNVLISGFVCH